MAGFGADSKMLIDCFAGDLTSEPGVIDAPVALFPLRGNVSPDKTNTIPHSP